MKAKLLSIFAMLSIITSPRPVAAETDPLYGNWLVSQVSETSTCTYKVRPSMDAPGAGSDIVWFQPTLAPSRRFTSALLLNPFNDIEWPDVLAGVFDANGGSFAGNFTTSDSTAYSVTVTVSDVTVRTTTSAKITFDMTVSSFVNPDPHFREYAPAPCAVHGEFHATHFHDTMQPTIALSAKTVGSFVRCSVTQDGMALRGARISLRAKKAGSARFGQIASKKSDSSGNAKFDVLAFHRTRFVCAYSGEQSNVVTRR